MMTTSRQLAVYILGNAWHSVLYTGVTNNLARRIHEHREHLIEGFTKRYNVSKLLWYELCESAEVAIAREKQIKAGSRKKKLDLIRSMNPKFLDLYETIL